MFFCIENISEKKSYLLFHFLSELLRRVLLFTDFIAKTVTNNHRVGVFQFGFLKLSVGKKQFNKKKLFNV